MHRPFSSIRRHALTAALGLLLAVLSGCGAGGLGNPVAPIVAPSHQTVMGQTLAKSKKKTGGTQRNSNSSSGVTSGSSTRDGVGKEDAPLVTE